jgi:hypothetical protein
MAQRKKHSPAAGALLDYIKKRKSNIVKRKLVV